MPTFDAGQRILDAIQRLSTTVDDMRVDLNSVRVDLNSIRVDLNSLRADVNGKFEGLELRMSAESAYFSPVSSFTILIYYSSYNHTARVYNSHVSSRDTPIRELYNQRNVAEPGFPRDSAALMRLPG